VCDWKHIFLQWIVGSIFLNCGHPEKHNKINGLDAVILCKQAGVQVQLAMRQVDESVERSGLP
jgi:hypothetical protein